MYQRLQNTGVMREGEDDEDIRLLFVGKTGSGKSTTGNIIFNDRVFESGMSSSSVTRVCRTHTAAVDNRSVTTVDTPDFIFSTHTDFDSDSELKRALDLCSPGAHVILLFLPLNAFTEQEKDFIRWFEQKFGAEALRFTLVLFTHADKTHQSPLRALIRRNIELSEFINRCSGGFCGMNIKAPANRRQVNKLMEKIDRLVSENTNSCYTLDMMKENERRREEERREREHQIELDRVREETEIRVKREYEQKLEQERARILENKEEAKKREKHSLFTWIKPKYVGVFMVFAVVTGGAFIHKEGSTRGFLTRGFIIGSASTAGVFTGILWRLMWKSQIVCSSSPSAVRQLLLKTAGVVCGGVFAGAVINHFKEENLLCISVLAGAAGAFTAIHWSS